MSKKSIIIGIVMLLLAGFLWARNTKLHQTPKINIYNDIPENTQVEKTEVVPVTETTVKEDAVSIPTNEPDSKVTNEVKTVK